MLAWLIHKILTNPKIPMQGGFVWSRPISDATLEVQMVISLIPTVTSIIAYSERLVVMPHLDDNFLNTNQGLYENKAFVQEQLTDQTIT
jgi:hypothetical protein